MKDIYKKFRLKNIFKEDESRFVIGCGLKFSGIFLGSLTLIYYSLWILLSINSIYFESFSKDLPIDLKDSFLQLIFSKLYLYFPEFFACTILLFFVGLYVGKVLLRPFEQIGSYCEKKTLGEAAEYNPDQFTDYKLLSRFSEYFFTHLESCIQESKLSKQTIPPQYSKIHSPPFEKVFFFHFTMIVLIIASIIGTLLGYLVLNIEDQIVDISFRIIGKDNKGLAYFLDNQTRIYASIVISSCLIITIGYLGLCFHLYGKIAGAIFGFFATMRAHLKGSFKARVHLIGYPHVRPFSRQMNKFLDHVERQCTIDNNKKQNISIVNSNNKR